MRFLFLVPVCVLFFLPRNSLLADEPLSSGQEHTDWVEKELDNSLVRHTFDAANGMMMPYRLYEPDLTEGEVAPLLVFLHGRGDRGRDNRAGMFKNIGLFNGTQAITSARGQAQFKSYVLVPQASDHSPDEEWAHWIGNSPERPFDGLGQDGSYQQHPVPSLSAAAALELIDWILKTKAIDTDRVYITGVSMGGFGTWEFVSRRPNLFAAAVPMAGYSDPTAAEQIKHIPFWIFHGEDDEYNPVQGSRNMAALLLNLGGSVRYTELPGAKHIKSFELAWKNEEILPWLFAQKK